MTAVVKRRFEDGLQDLEHRLLDDAIDDVRDTETPLPTSGLGDPHPANVARLVLSREQRTAQFGKEIGRCVHDLTRALSVHTWSALVARYVEQRASQIRNCRYPFQQPIRVGCPGGRVGRFLDVRL